MKGTYTAAECRGRIFTVCCH
uniref:Uncharacterized protein n=1 Tax=Anopheles albimanus TaxID=7167 RepID=A0A182FYM0_ANOAL